MRGGVDGAAARQNCSRSGWALLVALCLHLHSNAAGTGSTALRAASPRSPLPVLLRLRGGSVGTPPPGAPPSSATGCVAVDSIDCCAPRPEYAGQDRELVWKERAIPPWAEAGDGAPVRARILDLRAGAGEDHKLCKPRGCAVVFDPAQISIAPLWNEEIREADFPRWQDGSVIDEAEFRRCGEAGYPFHAWLRQLLPAGSAVWSPVRASETPDGGPSGSAERAEAVPAADRSSTRGGAATEVGAGLRIGGLPMPAAAAASKRGGGSASSRRRLRRSSERAGKSRSKAGTPSPAGKMVMCCNSVQSNFMAPYDFLVVDGAVVRQNYTKIERPLTGTACWVFQTSGAGPPRVVRVQLGQDDALWHQAEAPHGCPWGDVTIRTGLSGLPIILDGVNVCEGINQRIPGAPMLPNSVTWGPETTRAAFTAIGAIGASKDFIICVSVLEGACVCVCEACASVCVCLCVCLAPSLSVEHVERICVCVCVCVSGSVCVDGGMCVEASMGV